MLDCVYTHLVLEVGLRDLDNSFHISYLLIENFWSEDCFQVNNSGSAGCPPYTRIIFRINGQDLSRVWTVPWVCKIVNFNTFSIDIDH